MPVLTPIPFSLCGARLLTVVDLCLTVILSSLWVAGAFFDFGHRASIFTVGCSSLCRARRSRGTTPVAGVCRLQSLSADAGMHPVSTSWAGHLLTWRYWLYMVAWARRTLCLPSPSRVFPPPFSQFFACFLFPSVSLPLCRVAPHVLPAMSSPFPCCLGRCLAAPGLVDVSAYQVVRFVD